MQIHITFTDEDIELLKQPIPDNPCLKCGAESMTCCGCHAYYKWKSLIKKYEDLGIYGYALLLKTKRQLEKSLSEIQNDLDTLNRELPDELKNL